jgi:hypothetical protein
MVDGYDKAEFERVLAAYNRILKFNVDREYNAPRQRPPAGLLFHYTTADGL